MLHITHVYHTTATPSWRWPVFSKPAHEKNSLFLGGRKSSLRAFLGRGIFWGTAK
jgi:hypothetical protein